MAGTSVAVNSVFVSQQVMGCEWFTADASGLSRGSSSSNQVARRDCCQRQRHDCGMWTELCLAKMAGI